MLWSLEPQIKTEINIWWLEEPRTKPPLLFNHSLRFSWPDQSKCLPHFNPISPVTASLPVTSSVRRGKKKTTKRVQDEAANLHPSAGNKMASRCDSAGTSTPSGSFAATSEAQPLLLRRAGSVFLAPSLSGFVVCLLKTFTYKGKLFAVEKAGGVS